MGIDLKGTLSLMRGKGESDFWFFNIVDMRSPSFMDSDFAFASVGTFSGIISGEPCDSVNGSDTVWIFRKPRFASWIS
jgi:hypothetical protein